MKTQILFTILIIFFVASSNFSQETTSEPFNFVVNDFQIDNAMSIYENTEAKNAIDGNGNSIIVWEDVREGAKDIFAQRISDNGTLLGSNFMVNEILDSTNCELPTVAMNKSGESVVVWVAGTTEFGITKLDIWAQPFSSEGGPLGDNILVSGALDFDFLYEPVVALDASGNFVVVWRGGDYGNSNLFARHYFADGTPVGDTQIICDKPRHQFLPAIAMKENGDFILAWSDERVGNPKIYAQQFNADMTPVKEDFLVYEKSSSTWQMDPEIGLNPSGDFVIAWVQGFDNSDILAQQFSGDGTRQGETFQVNKNVAASEMRTLYKVVMNDDGSFLIGWRDQYDTRLMPKTNIESNSYNKPLGAHMLLFIRRFTKSGQAIGDPFSPTMTDAFRFHSIDFKVLDNQIYNVWTEENGVFANILEMESVSGDIAGNFSQLVEEFKLNQNFPNPFNPVTEISYTTASMENVTLKIYDILGREIRTLVNAVQPAGFHSVLFQGKNLPSGTYFYELRAGKHFVERRKMVLAK